MKKLMLSLMAAALATSGAHAAAVSFAGGSGALAGFTVINDFDSLAGVTVNSGTAKLFSATNNVEGAIPAFGPAGGASGSLSFLSVLGGGSASIGFAPAKAVSFDLGSLDFYNGVVLHFTGGGTQAFTGGQIIGLAGIAVPNNGNRFSPTTNGRLTYTGLSGQRIDGITLTSNTNSFEIDRLAVLAVPEPATWTMMILGFGAIGATLRRGRRAAEVTA